MPYCTRCGREIEEGARCICQKSSFTQNFSQDGIYGTNEDPAQYTSKHDPAVVYERGMKIVPENVSPDEGEIPIRQYDLCRLRSRLKLMFADGRLQITNKRVLFRAKGRSLVGPTVVQHEFAISAISGFQIVRNTRFSFLDWLFIWWLCAICLVVPEKITSLFANAKIGVFLLILSYLAGFVLMFLSFGLKKKYIRTVIIASLGMGLMLNPCVTLITHCASRSGAFVRILSYIPLIPVVVAFIKVLVACFVFSFKPNLQFCVCSTSGSEVINIRRERPKLFSPDAGTIFTGYHEVLPTDETDIAISEVGAILSDLQKLGDLAVEKWKRD